jgi:hypothetical protein
VSNPKFGSRNGDTSLAKPLLASPAPVSLQIEVVGSDLDGRQYMERTQTLTITRDGATILLANKLAPESELIIRNVLTDQEAPARVVGHIREVVAGHVYGVTLMDPSVDLWGVGLSPTEREHATLLECNHCRVVKLVSLTDIDMEVLESKHALTRLCACSPSATIWKLTTRDVAIERKHNSPRHRLGPEPAATPAREKRKDRRTAVKSVACIRHGGREEVAVCEDMSRGGFRFKSRTKYPKGTRIDAAVPYVHANVNIFVPAQIAYHQELSAVSHRHGASYLKTSRNTDRK